MLQGPGENAGVIDLGEGEAVAFKVESHNHPSAVEPFQGAATGVGGMIRDIVAMGARPVALLDGLCFGEPDWHFERAVEGIGHYGNAVGFPRWAETRCSPRVPGQLPRQRDVRRARPIRPRHPRPARTTGQKVVLFGSTTGRDGIGGASALASQELGEESHEKRPSVQVGDPATGKQRSRQALAVEGGLVESLQDLGAAGLASSLSEMARERHRHRYPPRPRTPARGGHGAVGDHDLREPGADGRRRAAGARRTGQGGLRALGASRSRRSGR